MENKSLIVEELLFWEVNQLLDRELLLPRGIL